VRLGWRLWLVSVAIGLVRYALQNLATYYGSVNLFFSILRMHHILHAQPYHPDLIIAHMNLDKSLFPRNPCFNVKLNVKPCFNVKSGVDADIFGSFDVSSWPLAYVGKFIPVPVRPLPDYFKPRCCWKPPRRGESLDVVGFVPFLRQFRSRTQVLIGNADEEEGGQS
jgi:hypothetical protein